MKRLILAALFLACGERPPSFAGLASIPLRGTAIYADGTPAANDVIEFSLLADGKDLFPAYVNGCSPGDDHAQALQVVAFVTTRNGAFSVNAPLAGFVRATDPTCSMASAAAARFSRIDVRAQTDADFGSCLPYCRKYRSDSCYADCVGQGQKFVWTSSLTTADVDTPRAILFEKLGPALPGTTPSPALPDLIVDGEAARNSAELTQDTFSPVDCAVQEGCVGAPGTRTLLRFDGDIVNVGGGDLQIGSPENNPLFQWSECHKHYHLQEIMTFELFDQTGAPAIGDTGRVVGRKQGFCIEGVEQVAGNSPDLYDCRNQGLASGWEDIYGASLNCQWLDVTGVPGGDYTLRVTVNASRTFPESDFDNDSELIPVSIP
ncbi:MAG: lysyl oxidase family protein [Myxococcales bacterium]